MNIGDTVYLVIGADPNLKRVVLTALGDKYFIAHSTHDGCQSVYNTWGSITDDPIAANRMILHNIDHRISDLKSQIAKLEATRAVVNARLG